MKQFKTRRPVPTVPTGHKQNNDSENSVLPEVEGVTVPTVPTVPIKEHIGIGNSESEEYFSEIQGHESKLNYSPDLNEGIYTFAGTAGTVGTIEDAHTYTGDSYTQKQVGTMSGNSAGEWEQPAAWPTLQPAEKMMALSDKLGFTWEKLPDGRYRFSRWDRELFREAAKLIHEIDQATDKATNNTGDTQNDYSQQTDNQRGSLRTENQTCLVP